MDDQLGVSIRLVREWKQAEFSLCDHALWLASTDNRDLPLVEKVKDAMAFIKSRIH